MSLRRTIRSDAAARRPASDSLNGARRAAELDALAAGEAVDVLVVGGGITGTWVALDAASRGLSVALVERGDLAQGTSRWSSKLVHGGLRYLASYDFGLAWESARERGILMEVSAPHLVHAFPMMIPLGEEVGRAAGAKLELGTRIGDAMRMLAGTSRHRLPPTRRISAEEARRLAPALSPDGLRGAILHWDGQLEDDARLVVAVARTAAAHGARILSYASASELTAAGATIVDEHGDGGSFTLHARHVVNAAGVWADELSSGITLQPSKGAHLLIPAARLGDPRALVNAPLPGSGGRRFVFAVPRPDGLVLVGLTDEPYDGAIPDVPLVRDEEERFLLDGINRVLERELTPADVVGRYAGLRPLLAGADDATADLSRRHAVLENDGILTVVGGKLTTARRMAQDAVDRLAARPGVQAGACVTRRLPLVGAERTSSAASAELPASLVRRYGAEAARVAALGADGDLAQIAPGVPVCAAELRFALAHELALTVDDLLDRRTRLGLVPERRAAALEAASDLLGAPLDAPG
jgi:glycerol-3-phosphate dehydrogenase